MSKAHLLSVQDAEHAAAQGWCLADVIDVPSCRHALDVLPIGIFSIKFPNVAAVRQHVVNLAQLGDAVALRALRAIATHNLKGNK